MRDNRIVAIENTKFIFMTNFSGDPKRDNFGSSRRKANLIIPTEEQAKDLADAGFKVKCTKRIILIILKIVLLPMMENEYVVITRVLKLRSSK